MGDVTTALLGKFKKERETDKKVGLIEQFMTRCIGTVTESLEKGDALRASQAYDTCAREVVLRNVLPLPAPVTTTGNVSSELRMVMGTFLHWHFQNFVLGPAGVLKGTWVQFVDGKETAVVEGFHPTNEAPDWYLEPKPMKGWFFREETVRIKTFDVPVTGHIDGEVCLNRVRRFIETGSPVPSSESIVEDLALFEMKSTDDNVLRILKKDGVEYLAKYYRCQAVIYQHAKGVTKSLFLYVDRKYFQFVGFEYEGEASYLEETKEKAHQIMVGLEAKKLPERHPECPFRSSKRAKACPYVDACFFEQPELIFEMAGD